MITLQRKLAVKVRDQVFVDGKAPKNIGKGMAYPVVGYSVQLREKERDGETKSFEEISVFLVINNRNDIGYIYPSYCDVYIDPFQEEICNSVFVKGENKPKKENEANENPKQLGQ